MALTSARATGKGGGGNVMADGGAELVSVENAAVLSSVPMGQRPPAAGRRSPASS